MVSTPSSYNNKKVRVVMEGGGKFFSSLGGSNNATTEKLERIRISERIEYKVLCRSEKESLFPERLHRSIVTSAIIRTDLPC